MNVFTFVFLTVCVVMTAGILQTWLKQRESRELPDEAGSETLDKIDRLEERIRVLERIITENRVDLKQEIDDL